MGYRPVNCIHFTARQKCDHPEKTVKVFGLTILRPTCRIADGWYACITQQGKIGLRPVHSPPAVPGRPASRSVISSMQPVLPKNNCGASAMRPTVRPMRRSERLRDEDSTDYTAAAGLAISLGEDSGTSFGDSSSNSDSFSGGGGDFGGGGSSGDW